MKFEVVMGMVSVISSALKLPAVVMNVAVTGPAAAEALNMRDWTGARTCLLMVPTRLQERAREAIVSSSYKQLWRGRSE